MSLTEEIQKPINIISVALALISISLSIYFYLDSQKKRQPVFIHSPEISQIFDNDISSPKIRVIDEAGNIIKKDIYLKTTVIWNEGDIPIEPDDVRKPVILKGTGIEQLLDYKIIEQTDPEVSAFRLTKLDSPENIQLKLEWNHFDPNHGAKIQLIYTGQSNPLLAYEGKIVGVSGFTDGRPLVNRWGFGEWISGFFGALGVVVYETIKNIAKMPNRSKTFKLLFIIPMILVTIMLGMILLKGMTPPL